MLIPTEGVAVADWKRSPINNSYSNKENTFRIENGLSIGSFRLI